MKRRPAAADSAYMDEALRLASRGLGRTSPNPAVGAVVVSGGKVGKVVGRGFHRRAGGPHAEVFALREAGRRAKGATLYVTLEPCSHFGRTPPCADAVLASGIRRVVVGTVDPNPRVRGRGIARLRRAGLEVDVGVRAAECAEMVADFSKRVTTGLPLVCLKLATTLDGRIATAGGDSRWVTGSAARRRVHEMRNRYDAILVGSGTVLADDPELTCRLRGGRDPLRVILDGRLRVPATAKVYRTDGDRTLVYTLAERGAAADRLRRLGVVVRRGGGDRPGSLRRILADLGSEGVQSVLIEGGGRVAARALREGLVDRLVLFVAPKILGGDGRAGVGPLGLRRMAAALGVENLEAEWVDGDLLLRGRPAFRKHR